MTNTSNDDQKTFWTTEAGLKWVQLQTEMDTLLQSVLDGVFDRAHLKNGQFVLDIGSGTGTSTLQAAAQVGPTGHIVGADISMTMTAQARTRADGQANVIFSLADVADHTFDPHSFDSVISRFGVMFFADSVAAFSNIKTAMQQGAQLTFACWGNIPNNPYFTLPAAVAKPVVGAPPRVDPDAPGPFTFRDAARVNAILTEAGFKDVTCDTETVALTPGGTCENVADLLCQIGPAQRALSHFNATQAQHQELRQNLTDALKDFETPSGVRIPAEIHFVTAKA